MSDRPTFSLTDDWVTLADLDHLTFRIYSILRTNAEFGRNGVVNHTLHVTASWVVDCTRHWKKPLAMSTVRKHMQKLVDAGVLRRVNDPKEGLGTIYEFVADPGEDYPHPVNGFEHAKRISRSRGTTSVYRRIRTDDSTAPSTSRRSSRPVVQAVEAFDAEPVAEEQEFDLSGLDGIGQEGPALTESQQEFAEELEQATGVSTTPHLRLMAGACRRIADAYGPALESGWIPRDLARRLAAELNPKVRMPEKLLVSKAEDIGKPPKAAAEVMPQEVRRADGLNGYVPPKQFRKRDGLPLSPEEQRKIDEKLRSYQAQRERANWLKS
ncbi:hypothetical protein SEA_KELA_182 [Streptomyces phage Kela]|jgi:hypothetical protein|nr:hypothetical protein SEA_KELA_182 [Streptomyces phage Kela]